MVQTLLVAVEEYGQNWAGLYTVEQITYGDSRDLLTTAARSKDPVEYIDALVCKTVKTPGGPLTPEKLRAVPAGLMRRLQELTLAMNDLGKDEVRFLQISSSSAAPPSQKTADSENSPSSTPSSHASD